MDKWHVIGLLIAGLGLLAISIIARARFGDRYELKTIDLVLIVVPLLFALLISGKLQMLEAFGVKADLSELFSHAADTKIQSQVAIPNTPGVDDVVHMLETAAKGSVEDIPRLVKDKTEALAFRLGYGGYYGPAIQAYFDALYASSYLQYLIVLDDKNKLFWIYKALDLAVHFRTEGNQAYREFARWLNDRKGQYHKELSDLPGFIGRDKAVAPDLSKRDALRQMEETGVNSLPVVDAQGNFIGTVERSQLTASLILEVSDRLEGKTGESN